METIEDVKNYVINTYGIKPNKFAITKHGSTVYMFIVDAEAHLHREFIIRISIPEIDKLPVLRKEFERSIKEILTKHKYVS
jgi:hypothetical protein